MSMKDILIIDDSAVARMIVKSCLKGIKLEIAEAGSGEAALAAIDEGLVAKLILLDLTMPGLSGLDTLKELKKRGVESPIVIITADMQKKTLEEAREFGAFETLGKPVNQAQLSQILSRLGIGG